MKGIIFASFGSTYREAFRKSINKAFSHIKDSFPDYYINECFSSEIVRKRVEKRDGDHYMNITEALKDMEEKGITDIYVLALYVIEGVEYNKIIKMADQYNSDKRLNITFTKGLLNNEEDISKIAEIFKKIKEDEYDSLVLMGHGSNHDEDIRYHEIQQALDKDESPIFIGTVEGEIGLEDIILRMKETNIKKVQLAPFMLVAGDHAENDMASDDEDSWKSILESKGFEVYSQIKGLCEYDQVNEIFADKLREILWN